MEKICFWIICCLPFCLWGQERGVTPVSDGVTALSGTTRALVVGISKYQDEGIPTLRFAHTDAEEFVKFLKSKSGGSLGDEQIVLLTNEEATSANIYNQLYWLLEETKENDQVIVYFSGHGDVETKTSINKGFLLAYNSPPTTYMIGGTVRVSDMNAILNDLVNVNKAKVLLVTDACRSGKLAGGIDGATSTAAALSQRINNQIKIMSCQANELSLEGEQWGGGRGVFSYHMIDGLMGMADTDGNSEVYLYELENYLKGKVPPETNFSQFPLLVGSPKSTLSFVDELELEQLMDQRKTEIVAYTNVAPVGKKGKAEMSVDTTTERMYQQFLAAIKDQYFLPEDLNKDRGKGQSASELYDHLSEEPALKDRHNAMRRNFVAALENQSQESLNAYLKAAPEELKARWSNAGGKYQLSLAYLEKAASLLGKDHRLYSQVMAKKFYFEGLLLRLEAEKENDLALFKRALDKVTQAIQYDETAAYAYNEIGWIYKKMYNMGEAVEPDRIVGMFEKAKTISPKWVMPYINLSQYYDQDNDALNYKTNCLKAYSLDSNQLGALICMADLHYEEGEYEKAINFYEKAMQLDLPVKVDFYNGLGLSYIKVEAYDEAEQVFQKARDMAPLDEDICENLSLVYFLSGNYEDCVSANLDWLKIAPANQTAPYNIACLKSLQGKGEESVVWLEKAIENGFQDFSKLKTDGDLENARKAATFEVFEKKYLLKE